LAAKGGHLECLVYAHENGCAWDSYTCAFAAEKGHLKCLVYAHEHGCPWDSKTFERDRNFHMECVKYAYDNGCPLPIDSSEKELILEYIRVAFPENM
jgi:hypothetical protein